EYIYSQRDAILSEKQMLSRLIQAKNDILDDLLADDEKLSGKALVNDVYEKLKNELRLLYPFTAEDEKLTPMDLEKKISSSFEDNLKSKQTMLGEEVFNGLSRQIYLFEIDKRWQDHLDQLTELMDSVRLRSYAQKNPLVEYKLEGFDIFDEMLENIRKSVLTRMLIVRIKARETAEQPKQENLVANHGGMNQLEGRDRVPAIESRQAQTVVRTKPKIGRNDPCPCGSGKKYKNCCGRNI
ncbi:MAG: SEC-C domain-containing protein, partial [Candidatus Cloacimonetes bacterium]|nr:SEC-C domain-containing protein [Candidatus Cloacimonadota bacterium]